MYPVHSARTKPIDCTRCVFWNQPMRCCSGWESEHITRALRCIRGPRERTGRTPKTRCKQKQRRAVWDGWQASRKTGAQAAGAWRLRKPTGAKAGGSSGSVENEVRAGGGMSTHPEVIGSGNEAVQRALARPLTLLRSRRPGPLLSIRSQRVEDKEARSYPKCQDR